MPLTPAEKQRPYRKRVKAGTSCRSQSTNARKSERQAACGQLRQTSSRTLTKTLYRYMDACLCRMVL